jgi:hypothetical protein
VNYLFALETCFLQTKRNKFCWPVIAVTIVVYWRCLVILLPLWWRLALDSNDTADATWGERILWKQDQQQQRESVVDGESKRVMTVFVVSFVCVTSTVQVHIVPHCPSSLRSLAMTVLIFRWGFRGPPPGSSDLVVTRHQCRRWEEPPCFPLFRSWCSFDLDDCQFLTHCAFLPLHCK